MKYISLISLAAFVMFVFLSKSLVTSSFSEHNNVSQMKNELSSINAKAYLSQGLLTSAQKMDVDSVRQLIKTVRGSGSSIAAIQNIHKDLTPTASPFSGNDINTLLNEWEILDKQRIITEKQTAFIGEYSEYSQQIKQLGARILNSSRAVTKELAKGRSTQGQIYYASNQSYLVQELLNTEYKLSTSSNVNIADAKKLVAYAQAFKQAHTKMIKGDNKNGAGQVKSQTAFRMLLSSSQIIESFMKNLSQIISSYEKLSIYRASLNSIWTSNEKLKSHSMVLINKLNELPSSRANSSNYRLVEKLSGVFGILTIIFSGLAYRNHMLQKTTLSKAESDSFKALKEELSPLENGDLTTSLSEEHMHTSTSAKVINRFMDMFKTLVISLQRATVDLDDVMEPIEEIRKQQALIDLEMDKSLKNTEATATKLSISTTEIAGMSNHFERLQARNTEHILSMTTTSTRISEHLNNMVKNGKHVNSSYEKITHGLTTIADSHADVKPKLNRFSSELINLSLNIQDISDQEKKAEIEKVLTVLTELFEQINETHAQNSDTIITTINQTTDSTESFDNYRATVSEMSEINTEIVKDTAAQKQNLSDTDICSSQIFSSINSLIGLAEDSLQFVRTIKNTAESASQASQDLSKVIKDTTGSITEISTLIDGYKVS